MRWIVYSRSAQAVFVECLFYISSSVLLQIIVCEWNEPPPVCLSFVPWKALIWCQQDSRKTDNHWQETEREQKRDETEKDRRGYLNTNRGVDNWERRSRETGKRHCTCFATASSSKGNRVERKVGREEVWNSDGEEKMEETWFVFLFPLLSLKVPLILPINL